MHKNKSHKGTLKRMKVTGGGKVTFRKRGKSHLNSHMSGAKLRSLRRDETLKAGDVRRLERILQTRLAPRRKD